MTVDRAIEVLMTDMGCYSCTFGCDTPYKCLNDSCEFKEAIHLAVERLKIELLPKMIKYEPQTDIHDLTDCDFCKDRNCKDCEDGKNEPQEMGSIERPKTGICAKCDRNDCEQKMEHIDNCNGYIEPQTERGE